MTRLQTTPDRVEAAGKEYVDQASRTANVAEAALTQVVLAPVAFGVLCSFVTPAVNAYQMRLLSSIRSIAQAMEAHGQAIVTGAEVYRAVDATVGEAIRKLGEELDK